MQEMKEKKEKKIVLIQKDKEENREEFSLNENKLEESFSSIREKHPFYSFSYNEENKCKEIDGDNDFKEFYEKENKKGVQEFIIYWVEEEGETKKAPGGNIENKKEDNIPNEENEKKIIGEEEKNNDDINKKEINNVEEKNKINPEQNNDDKKLDEKKNNIEIEKKDKDNDKKEEKSNNGCKRCVWLFGILTLVIAFSINFYLYPNFFINLFGMKKKRTIIGIDFGSTFSGYFIKFDDFDRKEVISSELIMEKDDKIAYRIGELAHLFNKSKIVIQNKLYFSKFKRNLDPEINNNFAESKIPEGVKVELETVIECFLELLRKKIIKDNADIIHNDDLNNIQWIIAVPPLWDEKGKNFMKNVAIQSGMINSEIALEPEAASLTIFDDENIKPEFKRAGKSFLIVDAGGYTVDISANKIKDKNHNLIQLLKPTSYRFGSNLINDKIIEIVESVYGKETIEKVKTSNYDKWEKTLDEIEKKKREIDTNIAENFKLSIQFNEKRCGYFSDSCEGKYNNITIHYTSSYIEIPNYIIKEIISNIAQSIVNEINKSFSKTNENIDLIVITGGFSECTILRKLIKQNFQSSLKEIVFLKLPQESVMKGAALFGQHPNQIIARISPITIGADSYDYIDSDQECEESFTDEEGKLRCLNYIIFVERGALVETNKDITFEIKPASNVINYYYSFERELNKNNVLKFGNDNIPESDIPLQNRTISVSMKMGNYLNVTVMDKNTNEASWKMFYYPS